MLISDAVGLAMLKMGGAEQFDTGKPTRMWAIFDKGFLAANLDRFQVSDSEPMMLCRTSDVAAHGLVKKSRVVRVSDGSEHFVRDLEPDGVGMTLVRLS